MTRRLLSAALLLAFGTTLCAALPPELTALQQQYAFAIAERVTSPYETDRAVLDAKYLAALANATADAKKAGKLPEILAMAEDKKLIEAGQPLPEKDDEKTPESLKKLRGIYRSATAKLAQQRSAAQAGLRQAYTASLQALEITLTKTDRLAEAKEVLAYREALPADIPELSAAPAKGPAAAPLPLSAKDGYTNTLGMKFVPVKGTKVMFGIHEVRYQDYAAYAAVAPGVDESWKNQTVDGFKIAERAEDHPVTKVSWEDAQKFCEWLSKKEGKTYRLPTDEEWSYAVGIGREEKWKKDTTPATVTKNPTEFQWGDKWPPPKGSGNYSDDSRKAKAPTANAKYLEGYDDGFPTTAPVMSFAPNKLGLYDLAGNVREWVADWYDTAQKDRTLRGACWTDFSRGRMLCSDRNYREPGSRISDFGFRIVLVPGG